MKQPEVWRTRGMLQKVISVSREEVLGDEAGKDINIAIVVGVL